MTTPEERLSRLEAAYEHVATKADLQSLETRMTQQMGNLEARLLKQFADSETRMTKQVAEAETRMVKWMVGLMIGSVIAATAFASAVALLAG